MDGFTVFVVCNRCNSLASLDVTVGGYYGDSLEAEARCEKCGERWDGYGLPPVAGGVEYDWSRGNNYETRKIEPDDAMRVGGEARHAIEWFLEHNGGAKDGTALASIRKAIKDK